MGKVNKQVKKANDNNSENVKKIKNTKDKKGIVSKLLKRKSNLKSVKTTKQHSTNNVIDEKIDILIKEFADKKEISVFKLPEKLASNETVQKTIDILKDYLKNHKKEKHIFDDDYKYMLQVNSIKIPKCPKRMPRMQIPHGLHDKSNDICLFVCDLKRGRKVDFEPTILHYQNLLSEQNIQFINTVMPMTQVCTEYLTFEMKRKLAASYDLFLSDARLTKNLFGFLGNAFIKSKKVPTAVNMSKKDLKSELEKKINTIMYKQNPSGAVTSINVGKPSLTDEQIIENVEFVLNSLKTLYPGGWANIRSVFLTLSLNNCISCPLYMTTHNSNDVMVPVVLGPQKQAIIKTKNQLNSVLTNFHLKNNGQFVKNQIEEFNIRVTDEDFADVKNNAKEFDADSFGKNVVAIDKVNTDEDTNIDEIHSNESEEEKIKIVAEKSKTRGTEVQKTQKISKTASSIEKVLKKIKKKITTEALTSKPLNVEKKIIKKEILKNKKGKIAKIKTSATRLTMPVC